MNASRLTFLLFYLVCGASTAIAQAKLQPLPSHSSDLDGATYCGNSITVLDALAQKTKPDTLIIVIAHLGDGETREQLNRRRLHNVKVYLTEYLRDAHVKRQPDMLVLAAGQRVKGLGRVEFYVKGELFDTLKLRPNADLLVGTCYPDPGQDVCALWSDRNIYPCLDRLGIKHHPMRPQTEPARR